MRNGILTSWLLHVKYSGLWGHTFLVLAQNFNYTENSKLVNWIWSCKQICVYIIFIWTIPSSMHCINHIPALLKWEDIAANYDLYRWKKIKMSMDIWTKCTHEIYLSDQINSYSSACFTGACSRPAEMGFVITFC